MKNNLISAIAGWKSAALLALVAMVAAVAFSGVLSTSHTADAQTATLGVTDVSIDVGRGATVTIQLGTAPFATLTPTGTALGTVTDPIPCAEGTACDVNKAPGQLAINYVVSATGDGYVLLNITGVALPANLPKAKIINVSLATAVTKLDLKTSGSLLYSSSSGGPTITATATNASGGVAGVAVTFSTNHGTLAEVGTTTPLTTAVDTNASGEATATLNGPAVPGIATVTAKAGPHTKTVQVVFYGPAAAITAEPRTGAIGFNNQSTFVVVTVKDSGGNPVPGRNFDVSATGGVSVKGPSDSAVKVLVSANVDDAVPAFVAAGDGGTPAAVYPTAAKSIPACNIGVSESADTVPLFADKADGTGFGTNAKGQCVLEVKTNHDTPADARTTTTRGDHTITVSLSPTVSATATITVGGPASRITSDAPERVDALSETTITATVLDDTDVPVGAVAIRIDQVEGEGIITSGTTDATTMTKNGKHSFTYLAPRSGTAVFRVQAGTGTAAKVGLIEVAIGPEPEPEPEAPSHVWGQPLTSGTHNLVWNGEDGAPSSDGALEGVVAIWQWDGNTWLGYFPAAADAPGANNLTSLTHGAPYFVVVE